MNKDTFLFPFQKATYERLHAFATACIDVNMSIFKYLKIRKNFLLIGPTGSGKTHLARTLADQMDVPFLAVSISDWIILGSTNRGGASTWPLIVSFAEKHRNAKGAIIFIDEIDKVHHDSNWNSFLRSEVFSLCDSRVPHNLNDSDGDSINEHRIQAASKFLENKTMIIAGAAFQDIWDSRSAPVMGFIAPPPVSNPPELCDLTCYLPRELINRFASELFILPQLTKCDYRAIIESIAVQIPDPFRRQFLQLGIDRLDLAVRHQKGARYAEEVLLAAIVSEQSNESCLKTEPHTAANLEPVAHGGDIDIDVS